MLNYALCNPYIDNIMHTDIKLLQLVEMFESERTFFLKVERFKFPQVWGENPFLDRHLYS